MGASHAGGLAGICREHGDIIEGDQKSLFEVITPPHSLAASPVKSSRTSMTGYVFMCMLSSLCVRKWRVYWPLAHVVYVLFVRI